MTKVSNPTAPANLTTTGDKAQLGAPISTEAAPEEAVKEVRLVERRELKGGTLLENFA